MHIGSAADLCKLFFTMILVICVNVMRPQEVATATTSNVANRSVIVASESSLLKFIRLFSASTMFNRLSHPMTRQSSTAVDYIIGDDSVTVDSTPCSLGDDGEKCKRSEARRAANCPQGLCYCYDCTAAGPELWVFCCREVSRCCSYVAAACRTCDQPTLYPFCLKHFNKCMTIGPPMNITQLQSP